MKTFLHSVLPIVVGLSIVHSTAHAALNPSGSKCGKKRCSTVEYCSPFDSQCIPCSNICDPSGHNHQPDLCVKDCQEYLHDQRYVLREDLAGDPNLKAEVQRLKTLVTITLTLTCISLVGLIFLLTWKFLWIKKIRKMVQAGWFRKKWIKKATNNNRVQDDAEVGGGGQSNNKQNVGLKLAMPTISGTVVAPRSNNGDGTPNTTSTPLSRRHPSEDTTLDYAYDNPAMTPSPESQQPRTKRESSF
ncbi:protein grindelwald [Athalia rosae]|uniref:protein grindelwald n=1 Tax=Athalia rosae TaxID=37344 RepID=UPI002033B3E2|nr:protein grindelwald [Athalia rosae]